MIFLYILLVVLISILAIAIAASKNYHVERTILINKPLTEVFNYIKYLKNKIIGLLGKRKIQL